MNEKDPRNRNERLREVLRRGDPGGGEAGLTSDEAQAMRRTVLAAAPEPRERLRLVPVFFTAAAAVLSCIVGLSLWRMHDQPVQPVQLAAAAQAARPAAPAPRAVPQAPPPPEPSVKVAAASPPARPRRSVKHPSAPDRPVEEVQPEEPQETATRQVQFSAPGGTRIIWLLTEPPQDTR